MDKKTIMLINGSPRKKGTSFSFARTMKGLIEESGNKAQIIHVIDYFDNKSSIYEFKSMLSEIDIIAIISPLYVDTLPYPVIWFLEEIQNECNDELYGKSFFALGQNGFPDSTLMQPLLETCRLFALDVGMQWLGGIGYGGGAIINGTHMENLGRKGRKITIAFKLLIEDVLSGKEIACKVQKKLTVKIPKILYKPLALLLNQMARKEASKHGVKDLECKAYLE